MAEDLSKYPNHLRKMIKQTGLSVEEVADETGIPLRTLFDYCAGKVPISRKRSEEIALVIGCAPHCLVPAIQKILSTILIMLWLSQMGRCASNFLSVSPATF